MIVKTTLLLFTLFSAALAYAAADDPWRYTNEEHGFTIDVPWRYTNKPVEVTKSDKPKAVHTLAQIIRGDGRAACYMIRFDFSDRHPLYSKSIRKTSEFLFRMMKNRDSTFFHPGLPYMGDTVIEANLAEEHPTWSGWRMDILAKTRDNSSPIIAKRKMVLIEYQRTAELLQLLEFFCVSYGMDNEAMHETIHDELQPMIDSLTFTPPLPRKQQASESVKAASVRN